MIKKIIFALIILVIGFLIFNRLQALPLIKPSPVNTPVPSPANNSPEEIKYDASTDLKKELDDINPAILDSDFK